MFDPENPIVKLCAEGMAAEMQHDYKKAKALFDQAWETASDDFEKFVAAHYVARLQSSTEDKLQWDQTALELAMGLEDDVVKGSLPSLYLNLGKGYEDMGKPEQALEYYHQALSHTELLEDDEYGKMTKAGIEKGIARVKEQAGH